MGFVNTPTQQGDVGTYIPIPFFCDPNPPPRSEFFVAGVFRLLSELATIVAPMVLRETILFVEGKATAVPNSLAGGVGLAVSLLALVLLKATALQHFIHGGGGGEGKLIALVCFLISGGRRMDATAVCM